MNRLEVCLCDGCDMASVFDVAALEQMAAQHPGVTKVHRQAALCDRQTAKGVRESLAPNTDAVVIGACSQRFVPLELAPNGRAVTRVALRELVAWSHEPKTAETQAVAEDQLRMGLVRAAKSEVPVPQVPTIERRVLVVGGGVTGLSAAITAAKAGYAVELVERQSELGGWLRSSERWLPTRAPYRELESNGVASLVEEAKRLPSIRIRLDTTIQRIVGEPGNFDVTLKAGGSDGQATAVSEVAVRVGAIVQATGWKPYDATKLGHLGYGTSRDVVTNVEFEQMLSRGELRRPSDGKPARRIAFIQCAGSRDPDHLPYCSTVCCRTTLKQALWARELDHDTEIYVLAKDVRAPGLHEGFYRRAQEDPLVFFTKGEVHRVRVDADASMLIEVNDGLLGDAVALAADLVVLAVGMVPRASNNDALRQLAEIRVQQNKPGQAPPDQATVRRLELLSGTGTLELGYRQGPDLPLDRYGFPDSHFVCFPYETRRTGIYAAGAVRSPSDQATCRIDGQGAALKAIQAILHAGSGVAMHPRWGDAGAPQFTLMRCTQCKRCTEECPFGTLDEDEKGTPKPNPGRCRRCGICMGACPERIVAFPEYSVDQISTMIKSVPIPDEFEESPRILVLACENDAYPALELAGFHRHKHSPYVRSIAVRCLGAINTVWIADAMAMGYDGVLLLGCKPGDDSQCHFLRGSDLMSTRSENVKQKLQQLALEDERVRIEHVTIADYATVCQRIDSFVERIVEIGLNPFKDA